MVSISRFVGKLSRSADRRARICAAINSRLRIEFVYHDHFRSVEPFCLGVVTPSRRVDNEVLLGYQVGGQDELGGTDGWKLFRLADVSGLHIVNERFTIAGHEPDPYPVKLSSVYCCIAPDGSGRFAMEADTVAPPAHHAQVKQGPRSTHDELMRRFRHAHRAVISRVAKRVAGLGCAIRKRR